MGRKELEAALDKYEGHVMSETMQLVFKAAKEHLKTLPQTKMINVWHVEYTLRNSSEPRCEVLKSRGDAVRFADRMDLAGFECINVTGPHQHEIKA